jgi:hypothetical protein
VKDVARVTVCVFLSLSALFCGGMGCSSRAALVGAGGTCLQATDCQEGLVCIPAKNGISSCSSNLSGVQELAPTPDAALPPLPRTPVDAGDAATADGAATTEDADDSATTGLEAGGSD